MPNELTYICEEAVSDDQLDSYRAMLISCMAGVGVSEQDVPEIEEIKREFRMNGGILALDTDRVVGGQYGTQIPELVDTELIELGNSAVERKFRGIGVATSMTSQMIRETRGKIYTIVDSQVSKRYANLWHASLYPDQLNPRIRDCIENYGSLDEQIVLVNQEALHILSI